MRCRTIPYICVALVVGCTSYYLTSNLNTWQPGQTKEQFIASYPRKGCGFGFTCDGFEVRAAQRQPDGALVEVGALRLARDGSDPVEYWLVFRNGVLEQWGQPEDWQKVSARYQIDFNPSASVRTP